MKYQELRDAVALPEGIDLIYAIHDAATPETVRALLAELDAKTEALEQLRITAVIAQGNMRSAAKYDSKWEGCAEAIEPQIAAARAALSQGEQDGGN